jgi:hypothetical protein
MSCLRRSCRPSPVSPVGRLATSFWLCGHAGRSNKGTPSDACTKGVSAPPYPRLNMTFLPSSPMHERRLKFDVISLRILRMSKMESCQHRRDANPHRRICGVPAYTIVMVRLCGGVVRGIQLSTITWTYPSSKPKDELCRVVVIQSPFRSKESLWNELGSVRISCFVA